MIENTNISSFWPSLAEPFRSLGARMSEWVGPASEAKAQNGGYTITVELPGVAEEDVKLSAQNGMLSLKGEKKVEREEKGDTWFFSERQYGNFSRSFRLPPDADETGVSASLKDGVLTITVPKRKEAAKASRDVKIARD
jgi:HSP20 family protein